MRYLTQQFTAHPVGQGLFYSGVVTLKEEYHKPEAFSFKFVFDCGSFNTANANDEIELYRSRHLKEDNAILDLLVISHFDADHVSHIKQLLEIRKVKKVILPFATLEERLFLVLKYYNAARGTISSEDDSLVKFMLDPIGSLENHLDGDSTIYIVNSDSNKPFDGPGEGIINESNTAGNENTPLVFDIQAADIKPNIARQFYVGDIADGKLKMFSDSEKGCLKSNFGGTAIMEFLFYQRNLGGQNEAFFKAVYKAFCAQYGLPDADTSKKAVEDLIQIVKRINDAAPIKALFRKVKKDFPELHAQDRDIANLNSTALCMLHYNLPAIYTLDNPNRYWMETGTTTIKKFNGTNNTRIEKLDKCVWPYRCHWHTDDPPIRFPNCLLTSDSFFKSTEEVSDLYNKYQRYWERFWLFQVPHHGASSSAGLELLSILPFRLTKFINYGTTHRFIRRWQHPSPQLISDLVSSGQSNDVLPVNEFTGLTFRINYAQ